MTRCTIVKRSILNKCQKFSTFPLVPVYDNSYPFCSGVAHGATTRYMSGSAKDILESESYTKNER